MSISFSRIKLHQNTSNYWILNNYKSVYILCQFIIAESVGMLVHKKNVEMKIKENKDQKLMK